MQKRLRRKVTIPFLKKHGENPSFRMEKTKKQGRKTKCIVVLRKTQGADGEGAK